MTKSDLIFVVIWFGILIEALAQHLDPAVSMGCILAILIIARTSR